MRFLVDENVGQSVVLFLKQRGYDVLVANEEFISQEDRFLLQQAYNEERIVLTNDKDFGYLIYREKLPSCGVILFRFKVEFPVLKIMALEKILEFNSSHIFNHFIVASEGKIRVRKLLI
ncbi:MAG TPA: hypothetical protein DCX95_02645 [Elusimicrobia bacterium]|nr:hypothetical protein [Elusimicrobiota bacterium]